MRTMKIHKKKAEAEGKVTKTKLNQLRAGMTNPQVEAVMGPGRVAEWADVVSGAGAHDNAHDIEQRWHPARERKLVYAWDEYSDRILVGILANIDTSRNYTEAVRLNPAPGGR